MKMDIADDFLARRFLLGDISQKEQAEVEERAFLDSEFFEQLQASEDDLIDDYLYGDLSSEEKERFEKYFLSKPERYEALRIARALQRHVSQSSASESSTTKVTPESNRNRASFLAFLQNRHPIFRFSMAAAFLLIITAGIWIIIRVLHQQDNPAPIQVRQQNNQSTQLPQGDQNVTSNNQSGGELQSKDDQTSPEQNQASSNRDPKAHDVTANSNGRNDNKLKLVFSDKQSARSTYEALLLLPVGPVRGEGEVPPIKLPSKAHLVIFYLPLIEDTGYPHYQAILTTDDQRVVRTWLKLKARTKRPGRVVAITVPVSLLLPDQRYRVILSGISSEGIVREISAYYFQAIKGK